MTAPVAAPSASPMRYSPLRPIVSPLRYPGGKSSLYTRLRAVIRDNGLAGCRYVEPYAGGAGAAMGLLITGQVSEVVVNDLDPAIHAFWHTVFNESEWLTKQIDKVPLTVEEWQRQKKVYDRSESCPVRTLGLATLYLNRTNRSGMLNGGPIGGHDQSGNYKIDARFNRAELIDRVQLLAKYASKVTVLSVDGGDVISQYSRLKRTFIYADPPYFEKAGTLYLNNFTIRDHEKLAGLLNRRAESASWLLTYDVVPDVARLYPDRRRYEFSLRYTARESRLATEIAVLSDTLKPLPEGWPVPVA